MSKLLLRKVILDGELKPSACFVMWCRWEKCDLHIAAAIAFLGATLEAEMDVLEGNQRSVFKAPC